MTYINPIETNKRQLNAYGRFNYPEDYKEIIHVTKFERDTFVDRIPTARNALRENTTKIPQGRDRVVAGVADFLTRDRFDFDQRGTARHPKGPEEFVPEPLRTPTTKLSSYEFVNVWPTNLTSMRVAYGDSNVLRCSVEFAYDRFFTSYSYSETNQSVENTPLNVSNKARRDSVPQGFSRVLTGFADFATHQIFDFDKRGRRLF